MTAVREDRWPPTPPAGGTAATTPSDGPGPAGGQDTGRAWLRAAMGALAVLAAAAAVVSWDAQYVMVASARHTPAVAALEAAASPTQARSSSPPWASH